MTNLTRFSIKIFAINDGHKLANKNIFLCGSSFYLEAMVNRHSRVSVAGPPHTSIYC
ncbi:uncharacterized protein BDW43DRAFT_285862 [Aspergillus alliaceus]|uniref:uncharacterized protein n=1 Tax=Petromyces alliaceus TaxID=209559 RepID=UPI0012A6663A|nr:uncharacterized protein BDW43DRAFT_285862 [Aspergillus alliaceus]KAB8230397.1 hypothetical protein BDW43DRAFT_285862 [Aspergillus alliaceus]